jgi:TRAP-type uncharacterized transport system fused permease subunit
LLIVLFAMGFSVMNTGFWAIVSVMVVSFARPRRFWPKWKDMIEGFVDGGVQGAKMGCICALIGLLVQTFISSGLGLNLTSGIATWSHGSLFICCLILWVTTVIAGMAGVSVAAYFTAAAFAVPVLVDLGVPFAVAHFFIVFPAAFSTITPPVALVSLVASQIAECKYTSAALETCKVAAPGFIIPFLFVYSPSLLLLESPLNPVFWIDNLAIVIGFLDMQVGFVGFLLRPLGVLERGVLFAASVALIFYITLRLPFLLFAGVLLTAAALTWQLAKRKRVDMDGVRI